ncbi:MAG: hypothetical protein IT318_13135 [Anaerolineales bacterium]|nr:hypothetical protein [Anaerolineales bacterium]
MHTGLAGEVLARKLVASLIVAISILVGFTVLVCLLPNGWMFTRPAATQTAAAIYDLTQMHYAEVSEAIYSFHSHWLTMASHQDPGLQSAVATGRFLELFGLARAGPSLNDEPFWLVTKSVTVDNLLVLEYASDRFEAVANVELIIDRVSPAGTAIMSLPTQERCDLYVFILEEDAWKLSALFDLSDPNIVFREWDVSPDWLKQAIGELSDQALDFCRNEGYPRK